MQNHLEQLLAEASQVFILTDENVAPLWLPETECRLGCGRAVEIVLRPGEQHKDLQSVQHVWNTLMLHHADRNALLVNLGGGVITDLGGFAASTFKRGIRFVNIPTTLLAMVDAAIGGKTGIDFGSGKNAIGTFAEAAEIVVNPAYLETLPERQIRSGLAEMLKYGFIADPELLTAGLGHYRPLISRCGDIKRDIVKNDPTEKGMRKMLNFGHTLGHALESHCLAAQNPLLHGEAVALGMGAALWLSEKRFGLDGQVLQTYVERLPMLLAEAGITLSETDVEPVLGRLVHDKKSLNGQPRFVLLEAVGKPVWDVEVPTEWVRQSLAYIINKVWPR